MGVVDVEVDVLELVLVGGEVELEELTSGGNTST